MVDENKKTNLMQQQSQLLKIVRPPPILVTTKEFFSSRGWGELLGGRIIRQFRVAHIFKKTYPKF